MKNKRTPFETWALDVALRCAHQGTCRRRNYGAVLIDEDKTIVSTGYTGNIRHKTHCIDADSCWREDNNIPSGSCYEKCLSVHAEQNALLQAGPRAKNCTLYLCGYDTSTGKEITGAPCIICTKLLINAGVYFFVCRANIKDPVNAILEELGNATKIIKQDPIYPFHIVAPDIVGYSVPINVWYNHLESEVLGDSK